MENYKELIDIITPHKRRQLTVIGYDKGEQASRYDQLYDFLRKNPDATFEDCMKLFFPAEKRKQFTNMLGNFKLRLINALFVMDVKKTKYGSQNAAFITGWKNLVAIKIMLRLGARNAAKELIKQTLPHAIESENFPVVAELYRNQFELTCIEPNIKLANELYEKFELYHTLTLKYARTKLFYGRLVTETFNRSSLPKGYINRLLEAKQEIQSILAEYDYHRIWLYYYYVSYQYFIASHKHDQIVELMSQAIIKFEGSQALTIESIASLYHIKAVHLAAQQRFDDAIDFFEDFDKKFDIPQGLNWFVGKEFYCMVLLYKGDYQKALNEYCQVKKSLFFGKLPPFKRENWVLLEAFLQLMKLTGDVTTTEKLKLPRFSPAKFANTIIHNSKDKLGFNITYQILQSLFLLQTDKFDAAEDKIMSLYKYAQRHLKDEESTERAYYFICALTQIPRGGFILKEVEKRSADWLAKMRTISPMRSGLPFEVETISYEQLWKIGLRFLKG